MAKKEVWLTTKEAADLIGKSVNALRVWRQRCTGPDFYTRGRNVYYRKDDLLAWFNGYKKAAAKEGRESGRRYPLGKPGPKPGKKGGGK